MTQMLNYRTVLLAQTGIGSGIQSMELRSTPHQSLGFIKCIDDVVPTVIVHTYPNQKPWITGNICTELKGRAATFKEWDSNPDAYKKSCYALRRTIKQAKRQYRTKIESYYTSSDARRMWRKPTRRAFYARFEASNSEACMRAPAVPDDCVITLSVADVSKTLKLVNMTGIKTARHPTVRRYRG